MILHEDIEFFFCILDHLIVKCDGRGWGWEQIFRPPPKIFTKEKKNNCLIHKNVDYYVKILSSENTKKSVSKQFVFYGAYLI